MVHNEIEIWSLKLFVFDCIVPFKVLITSGANFGHSAECSEQYEAKKS